MKFEISSTIIGIRMLNQNTKKSSARIDIWVNHIKAHKCDKIMEEIILHISNYISYSYLINYV